MVVGVSAGDPPPGDGGESVPSAGLEREPVRVTWQYFISERREPGVVISAREYERIIERLEGCKPGGWADLWLAGVGVGAALARSSP